MLDFLLLIVFKPSLEDSITFVFCIIIGWEQIKDLESGANCTCFLSDLRFILENIDFFCKLGIESLL